MGNEDTRAERVHFCVRGKEIAGILHRAGGREPPCVIASHGLLSTKDSIKYIELANRLGKAGIAFFRFDFSGCGESEGRMEDCTVTGRREELRDAVRLIREKLSLGRSLGLMGSSLGGYLSLFQAAGDEQIKAAVIWASPHTLSGVARRAPDGGPDPGDAFYEDIKNHNLAPFLERVRRCLVIHGAEDGVVPPEHARVIHGRLADPKKLVIIPGADHRFSDPGHRETAYRLTVEWFKKFLGT